METGLSADTGVSHSFYWPPKAYLSSEALDEAVHKYLTVVKYKTKQKTNDDLINILDLSNSFKKNHKGGEQRNLLTNTRRI